MLSAGGAGEEVGDPVVKIGQVWGGGPLRAHLPLQGAQPVQGADGVDLGVGAQCVAAECGGLFQVVPE